MHVVSFDDGHIVLADSTSPDSVKFVVDSVGHVPLIIADPPYGNVVNERWDKVAASDEEFAAWLTSWTIEWSAALLPNSAFYVWGGIGNVGFRPFFKYMCMVEETSQLKMANMITWSKRRAYGLSHNYLFTREECAYFTNGDPKKPRTFNVPLLEKDRGYAGYNKDYPAKSEKYRRTNVWTDINEIFRGKVHPTQKTQRLHEVMIEVHTNPGEWVVDPFGGSGTTAMACRHLGRKFIVFENDPVSFEVMKNRLGENCTQ